jgi:hypothetical protein
MDYFRIYLPAKLELIGKSHSLPEEVSEQNGLADVQLKDEDFPLWCYAAFHWPFHARNSGRTAFDPTDEFYAKHSDLCNYWWYIFKGLSHRAYHDPPNDTKQTTTLKPVSDVWVVESAFLNSLDGNKLAVFLLENG